MFKKWLQLAFILFSLGLFNAAWADRFEEILAKGVIRIGVPLDVPPFGSQKEGVRVLVMCGRDEAQSVGGPSFDQLMSQMEETRVNQRAQRYLRDLRRDAVVEYR